MAIYADTLDDIAIAAARERRRQIEKHRLRGLREASDRLLAHAEECCLLGASLKPGFHDRLRQLIGEVDADLLSVKPRTLTNARLRSLMEFCGWTEESLAAASGVALRNVERAVSGGSLSREDTRLICRVLNESMAPDLPGAGAAVNLIFEVQERIFRLMGNAGSRPSAEEIDGLRRDCEWFEEHYPEGATPSDVKASIATDAAVSTLADHDLVYPRGRDWKLWGDWRERLVGLGGEG